MQKYSDKIDLLTQVTLYHENVGHLRPTFKRIIESIALNDRPKASELFFMLFQQSFIDHFTFEEEVVFPAVLAWKNSSEHRSLVDEYCSIHKKLLSDGRRISQQLADNSGDPFEKETAGSLVTLLAKLHEAIVHHAADENRILVPLISSNQTLRFLTARNHVLLKNKLRQSMQ